ncbi:MAG: coproporphyrinogen dehydrogenase HemZ [Ruminococcus sp.]
MRKILLQFSKKDFEYDVYSLVRAFYPSCDVAITYVGEEGQAGEFDRLFLIDYEENQILYTIKEKESLLFQEAVPATAQMERTERKNRLKQTVYRSLVKLTGKELPWGTLTGIRPTKIPMQMMEQGMGNGEIAQYMRQTYYTSNEKTALAIAVANQEKALLAPFDYENGYSLYVGIPFCPSICLYCSFGSHPLKLWEKRMEEYLEALEKELSFVSEAFAGKKLNSVYIGGGTPTTLHSDQLKRLLRKICQKFDLSHLQEFTVEAGRPDSITREKLLILKEFPVDRISINPQTMHQKTLDLIGRGHTVEQIYESYHLARELGFDNINMDLIVGLPGEGEKEVEETLRQIKGLNPDSLTVHSLSLKRATRLNLFKDQYQENSFENSREIMNMAASCAAEMEMRPYYLYRQKNIAGNFENVGYAKVDKAGIYNILIMEEKQTIMAVGAGASTKLVFDRGQRIERVENVKDVNHYISRIDEMITRKKTGIEKWLR